MKKRKVFFVLLILFMLVGITGCGNTSDSGISQRDIDKHIKENYRKDSNGKWYHK